jgi:hypothetical protein
MSSPEYDAYMKSEIWQDKRRMRLAFDQYECRNCHVTQRLSVHHWYYWRDGKSILGREHMEDLVTLCDVCHLVLTQRRQSIFGTGPSARKSPHTFRWVVVRMIGSLMFVYVLLLLFSLYVKR